MAKGLGLGLVAAAAELEATIIHKISTKLNFPVYICRPLLTWPLTHIINGRRNYMQQPLVSYFAIASFRPRNDGKGIRRGEDKRKTTIKKGAGIVKYAFLTPLPNFHPSIQPANAKSKKHATQIICASRFLAPPAVFCVSPSVESYIGIRHLKTSQVESATCAPRCIDCSR